MQFKRHLSRAVRPVSKTVFIKPVSKISNRFDKCQPVWRLENRFQTGLNRFKFKIPNNGGSSQINKATHLSLELQTRRLFKAILEPQTRHFQLYRSELNFTQFKTSLEPVLLLKPVEQPYI